MWGSVHDALRADSATLLRLARMAIRARPPNAIAWWSRALSLCAAAGCPGGERRVRSLGLGAAARAAAVARCRHTRGGGGGGSSSSSTCDAVALLLSQHALTCIMNDRPQAAVKWGASSAAVAPGSPGALHGCIHALKAAAALGWHVLPAHSALQLACCSPRDPVPAARGRGSVTDHYWHSVCSVSLASQALLSMHAVIASGQPLADPSALDPHSALYLSPSAAFQRAAAVLFACSLMISGGTSHPPPELRSW